MAVHLPYPPVYRPSHNLSISGPTCIDKCSISHSSEESHSFPGAMSLLLVNLSSHYFLSPALAKIVDAVVKVTIALPSSDR